MEFWLGISFGAFLCALLLTWLARIIALRAEIIDVPNNRSSHTDPTPSGGGVAIVAGSLIPIAIAVFLDDLEPVDVLAIVPPALTIAFVSFLDDLLDLPHILRFGVQLLAVIWFFYFLDQPPFIGISWLENFIILKYALSGLAFLWVINLFNFMDGIDGLAGSEAVFIALGITLLSFFQGFNGSVAFMSVSLIGACLGFLVWNWPPAKIFMGDVGSAYLGFMLSSLTLVYSTESRTPIWPCVILLGVFLTDATVTLVRRALSGQNWYEAHRSHAYQKLARKWGDHQSVTLAVIIVNCVWLFPMAYLAATRSYQSTLIAGVAFLPLIVISGYLKAGSIDRPGF